MDLISNYRQHQQIWLLFFMEVDDWWGEGKNGLIENMRISTATFFRLTFMCELNFAILLGLSNLTTNLLQLSKFSGRKEEE